MIRGLGPRLLLDQADVCLRQEIRRSEVESTRLGYFILHRISVITMNKSISIRLLQSQLSISRENAA